jgi:hypothetical protein
MRIFGFHDNSACAYYRVTLPLDAMRDLGGWEVQTACGWDDRALDYPVVIGQRLGKSEALPLWRRLYAGRKLVYETDDDMWSIDETNFRALAEHTPSLLDAAAEAIRMAHLTTVSTAPLAAVVERVGARRTAVLENHVDGRLLDVQRAHSAAGRVVVGWAGGDSHLKDMRSFERQFRRFMRGADDVEFHNIGTDFRPSLKIPGRHTGWQGIWDYYRSIDFDIGLAPLAHTPFNDSKSHIKALEYAALGIPVIASDELPYRDFVVHGVTGYLVKRDHEWTMYLRELTANRELREAMGQKAKEVAAEWTIQKGWERWADVYASLH